MGVSWGMLGVGHPACTRTMGLQYTLPFVQTSPLSQYWFVGSDPLDEQPYNLVLFAL